MANRILATMSISVSELKKNPMTAVGSGDGLPIAVLNHNTPAFYCVPADAYELLMDRIDDLELAATVADRQGEQGDLVNINELHAEIFT